jgi:hypothetical protein
MNPSDWTRTREALHSATQVLRSARAAATEPMPNALHYSSFLVPNGASTGPLGKNRELILDFEEMAITFHQAGDEVFSIGLDGQSPSTLFDSVFLALADAGVPLEPSREKELSEALFAVDKAGGRAFSAMMWQAFQGIARFKARQFGFQSPIALWPSHFDLSTLYFPAGHDESKDPQVNIGFSSHSDDVGGPYLYVYAWPTPEALAEKLPDIWDWNEGWGAPGASIPYASLIKDGDLAESIESHLAKAFPMFLEGLSPS